MRTDIENNRDLYSTILTQLKSRTRSKRSLEQYLLRLQELAQKEVQERALSPEEFARVVDAAFEGKPRSIPLEELKATAADESLPSWRRVVCRQIADLKEMDSAGLLQDEFRYFGIDAPTGGRWYNFDPHSFVECGMAGSMDGWTPESESSRQYVPGPVAYLDEDGQIKSAMPEELEQEAVPLQEVSWDDFQDFLWCGQIYE